MEFPPEHYFQTSLQRMRQAQYLFKEGSSYALAIYTGGVAVECLLRAFKGRTDSDFDERHNLLLLFSTSGILRVDRDKLLAMGWSGTRITQHLRALRSKVNDIYHLWANNYRNAAEERLRSYLKRRTGYRKIKGDYLKEHSRWFLASAQTFVELGVLVWHV